jgi:ribosomal protein L37AE/L43A
MAMNWVQFQEGLSMGEFMAGYGTEAKCRRALYHARWPRGFRCPTCEHRGRSTFRRHGQIYYQCRCCGHHGHCTHRIRFHLVRNHLRQSGLTVEKVGRRA